MALKQSIDQNICCIFLIFFGITNLSIFDIINVRFYNIIRIVFIEIIFIFCIKVNHFFATIIIKNMIIFLLVIINNMY
jgi:hypothetical protein